jgi:FtsP/CotA-like multicopper oxidase with cupredoxin domain
LERRFILNRRHFLASAGAVFAEPMLPLRLFGQHKQVSASKAGAKRSSAADHTLTIEPCKLEISPGVTIETVGYNGRVPGPILRLKQGVPVSIDVINKTANADLVHWHGLRSDVPNDGAMEEGSPMIMAGATQRFHLTPQPAGTRWYHTHNTAGENLAAGTYTGQFGFLMVDGGQSFGNYDQEFYLAVHQWEPGFVPMAKMMRAESANQPATSGSDVGYKYATINEHRLGAGEPLRVKEGQKVLLHLLNASATENAVLALPGHTFKVLALDGNPVPNPQTVETLSLAVAERIDCIVEMNNPGVWILGSTLLKAREMGLGVVVEYAGKSGDPVWKNPANALWDYSIFGNTASAQEPDETFELKFMDVGPAKDSKFDSWTINGKSWPDVEPLKVQKGKRYRLVFQNMSGDQHPMHLHRHSFEVVRINNKKMSGLIKDTVNMMPLDQVAVDFIADNPGDTLYHCHMQLHMDFGFMGLIKYV